MFGWLKKKKEPAETETAKFFKKLDEVRGQYMEKRFFPVIEGHLELLRENLQNVLDRPDPEKAKEYPDPTDDPWSAARREGRFVP